MIKQLRFFMLNLLVLVCAAAMADNLKVDFSSGLPSDWVKNVGTVQKVNYSSKSCMQMQKNTSITSPAMTIKCAQINLNITRTSKGSTFTVAYKIGDAESVTIQTINASDITAQQWKDIEVAVPAEAQKEGVTFMFFNTSNSYYISQIEFVEVGAAQKAETTTSFGQDVDDAKFTYVGEEAAETRTATVTPAEALLDGNGTLTYKSNRTDIVSVDETSGELVWGTVYGTAKITATYTAADNALFKDSEASYYVQHKRKGDPKTVVFDASDEDAFASILTNSGYPEDGDYAFVDLNGDSYSFSTHNAMCNYYGHGLQLKKVSTSDETAQGYVVSPTFEEKFEYGYRITVNYEVGHEPDLTCVNYPTETAVLDNADGTMYMDVPFADGIFRLAGGETAVTYIQSIELTPLDKPAEPTTMTFPAEEYNVFLGEPFEAPKAKLTNELGAELTDLEISYLSDNADVADVDETTGAVTIKAIGTAHISAYFWGDNNYKYSEASYTLNVTEKQLQEPGFYYEEPTLSASLGTGSLTAKDLWFKNPNNIAVLFSSSDEDVATVDEEGTVTLKAVGEVDITASFEGDDNYKGGESSCHLVIVDNRNESTIAFTQEEYTANMADDEWFRTNLVNERDLTPIVYTSSNTEVAEVGEIPGTVKLLSVGETTITATFEGNAYYKPTSASYKLVVVNNPVDAISSISLDNMPADAKVYNLGGQRVNAKTLTKGVYVVNGKKVVLK